MTLRSASAAGLAAGLSLLSLATHPARAEVKPAASVESAAPATVIVAVRTSFPAGALFVQHRVGTERRYLSARAFTGHAPCDPIELSMQAPSGEGEIVVFLNSPGTFPIDRIQNGDLSVPGSPSRPWIRGLASGLAKVSLVPGSTLRLEAAERYVPGKLHLLDVCVERCEPSPGPTAVASPVTTSSRSPAVPVLVSFSARMTDGSVFAFWTGAGAAPEIAGTTFLGRDPARPVEFRIVVPAGPGTLSFHSASASQDQASNSEPVPVSFAPVDTPRVEVTEVWGEPHGRSMMPPHVEVLLEPRR